MPENDANSILRGKEPHGPCQGDALARLLRKKLLKPYHYIKREEVRLLLDHLDIVVQERNEYLWLLCKDAKPVEEVIADLRTSLGMDDA